MRSPYTGLPPERFWKTGVVTDNPANFTALYKAKYPISPSDRIATAGSCFAQHIARHLRARGVKVLDAEPPPPGLSTQDAQRFGYNLYSARYGNIYYARQLLQILKECNGFAIPDELLIWRKGDRYFDAMRPSVEPDGLSSPDVVKAHRKEHLKYLRWMLRDVDIFVFTLGLTEGWVHTASGTVYPTAPGTIAGDYDPNHYSFKNFTYPEIVSDLREIRTLLKRANPNMKFLFTVSPVPLTATASGQHVLAATTYSKSVLRAVAGDLCAEFDDVDYFPSYEIISSPVTRGFFYAPNLRSVTDIGVETVMRTFFSEHSTLNKHTEKASARLVKESDPQCEEVLLEAFAS